MHKLLLLITTLILSSCVAMPVEYFEPKSDRGFTIQSECRGHAGPYDTQQIFIDDVEIQLSVGEYKQPKKEEWNEFSASYGLEHANVEFPAVIIGINLIIPKNNYVIWKQSIDNIRSDKNSVHTGYIQYFSTHDRVRNIHLDIDVGQKMVGSTMQQGGEEKYNVYKYYEGIIWTGMTDSNQVTIQELTLIVNGNLHSIDSTTFTKKKEFLVSPINC